MRHLSLANGRLVLTAEFGQLPDLIKRRQSLCAFLINIDEPFDEKLVQELVEFHMLGCNSFLCSGCYSESLHDILDERLIPAKNVEEVITTFHRNDEPIEDVISLFLELAVGNGSDHSVFAHGTSLRDKNMLAVLEHLSREEGGS